MPRRAFDDVELPTAAKELLAIIEKATQSALSDKEYLDAEHIVRVLCGMDPTPGNVPQAVAQDRRYRYALDSADAFTKIRDLQAAQTETGITGGADAAATFKLALDRMGVGTPGVHSSGLAEIYRAHVRASRGYVRPAMDARRAAAFARDCPEAARIKVL
jgi:hypothetical protein